MGKDNIPFHTVIWPAMLLGYGGLNLPYDVPANEFLNLEGLQFSTSRNWAVWLPDYLDRHEPDPLRYVLAANMPETSDSDFSWQEYVRSNNDELVATYGNLVHRVLTMIARNFDGRVPEAGTLEEGDVELLDHASRTVDEAGAAIEACRFRAALQAAMALAREANRYLERQAPWQAVRTDRQKAAMTLSVALSVVNCLKTVMYPFLPFSSAKLHGLLGFERSIVEQGWKWERNGLPPGHPLPAPEPLFKKLDEAVERDEAERIGRQA